MEIVKVSQTFLDPETMTFCKRFRAKIGDKEYKFDIQTPDTEETDSQAKRRQRMEERLFRFIDLNKNMIDLTHDTTFYVPLT